MANDGALILRADSLIKTETGPGDGQRVEGTRGTRRRRSFVASHTQTTPSDKAASATPPLGDEDDLPVLTDVVLPAELAGAENLESISHRLRQTLAAELGQLIDEQLSKQMPALVETALQHAEEQLRQAIGTTVDAVLRDFLAPDAVARLPSAGPGGSVEVPPEQA